MPDPPRVRQVVLQCLHCKMTLVAHELETLNAEGALQYAQEVVIPKQAPRELDAAVPAEVRSLFREGAVCEAASARRAAGVMYRATVEALAEERGASKGKLYDKIEHLSTTGLDADVIRDLHEARVLGNDSIHDGLEYAAEEVADVAELIREATVLIYVQPEQRRKLREARRVRHEGRKA